MLLEKGCSCMPKAIFRVQGIKTTGDLKGIGKHNVDRISHTNKDIDQERSNENITLKECGENYNSRFHEITHDLKIQHEEQMKTTRKSRRKNFLDKVNEDKADVACEFLMSASPEYFEGKSREEIEKWAETSLDFITINIGIEEKNVLHAVVHMDEKTPHLHVVAVPLVEKYDGRRKKDVLAISRKHFIKNGEQLAQIQTDYVDHLKENGIQLNRGKEKSKAQHLDVARYKIVKTEERLHEIENELLDKNFEMTQLKNEKKSLEKNLGQKKNELENITGILPTENIEVKVRKEVKTTVEDKLVHFGKPKVIKKETGNWVVTPKELKRLQNYVNAGLAVKQDYERLKSTDLVQENKDLERLLILEREENTEIKEENNRLRHDLRDAEKEIGTLKERVSDLRHEVKNIYQSAKEFLKDRTSDLRTFKRVFKELVGKVKEKTPRSEFERLDRVEKRKEKDRGMER